MFEACHFGSSSEDSPQSFYRKLEGTLEETRETISLKSRSTYCRRGQALIAKTMKAELLILLTDVSGSRAVLGYTPSFPTDKTFDL